MKSKILGLFTLFLVLFGQMGFAQTRNVSQTSLIKFEVSEDNSDPE